jgi:hypothetical protein
MQIAVREALWFHALYFAVAAAVLLAMHGPHLGASVLWLTIAYNLAIPALGLARGHTEWLWLWLFLVPLSMAQVLPDWALAGVAHMLVFPDLGSPRIGGEVPVYFMGLWMTLLFPVTLIAGAERHPYVAAGWLALPMFAFCEWFAPQLQLWYNRDVVHVGTMAVYPLVPEMMLAMTTLWAYRTLRSAGTVARDAGALAVSVFYAGALVIALVIERGWTHA